MLSGQQGTLESSQRSQRGPVECRASQGVSPPLPGAFLPCGATVLAAWHSMTLGMGSGYAQGSEPQAQLDQGSQWDSGGSPSPGMSAASALFLGQATPASAQGAQCVRSQARGGMVLPGDGGGRRELMPPPMPISRQDREALFLHS